MKRLFLALLMMALGAWGYVAWQVVDVLVRRPDSRVTTTDKSSLPKEFLSASLLSPDSLIRDPFQSFLYSEKPKPKAMSKPVLKVPKVIAPPEAVLTGILWGEQPVAILQVNGKSELLKSGDEAWEFKVVKIERHQVTVLKEGRKFILGY